MRYSLWLFVPSLFMLTCCTQPKGNSHQIQSILLSQHTQSIRELLFLHETLYSNRFETPIKNELDSLLAFHEEVRLIVEGLDWDIDKSFNRLQTYWEDRTLDPDSAILKEFPAGDLDMTQRDRIGLLKLEGQLITYVRRKLWIAILEDGERNYVAFSIPSPQKRVDDSVTYLVGVGTKLKVLPNFRLKEGEVMRQNIRLRDTFLHEITLSKHDPATIEILNPRLGIKPGYFVTELPLHPNKVQGTF